VGSGPVAVAHVSVHADDAEAGGTAEITFRVPTESDTASTVRLQVQFPAESPIAKVAVLPQEGWTSEVSRKALSAPLSAGHGHEVSDVVSQLEWRAEDREAAAGPGEYQVFRIVAGPLPRTDRLVFKVVQTYDDGLVQRWIEEPVAGAPEPEHPAPVLTIGAAGGHDEVAAVVPTSTTTAAPTWAAVVVSLVAMVAALGALLVALRLNLRARQQQ
jgi:uncharacterized protein YcnI